MFPPVLNLPLFLQSQRPKFNRFDFFIIFLFYRLMINTLELVPYCQLHTIIMSFGTCSTIPFTLTYFSLTDDLQTCLVFLPNILSNLETFTTAGKQYCHHAIKISWPPTSTFYSIGYDTLYRSSLYCVPERSSTPRRKFNRFDFFIIFLFYRLMINTLELVPYCQLHTIIMSFGTCSTIPFTLTYFSLTDDLQTCPDFLQGVQLLIFYSASVTDVLYLGIPLPSSSPSLWPWCSSFFQRKHITCLVIAQSNWYGVHK